MKRIALLLLCLLMAVSLLTGCNDDYPEGITLDFADMQLTLPGDFIDLSEEGINSDSDFLYGRKTLIVKGGAEEKKRLLEMNLEQYTQQVIGGNQLKVTPEVFREGYMFTYQKTANEKEFTYITVTFETKDNFWLFQFYCPSEDLEVNRQEIDIILSSIQPKIV